MTSRFHGILPPAGPLVSGYPVVPNDEGDLPETTRGILVGTAGSVAVIFAQDATMTPVTLPSLAAGVVHPLSVRRVMATGTTAGTIIGLV